MLDGGGAFLVSDFLKKHSETGTEDSKPSRTGKKEVLNNPSHMKNVRNVELSKSCAKPTNYP